jgi:hypothetical protein
MRPHPISTKIILKNINLNSKLCTRQDGIEISHSTLSVNYVGAKKKTTIERPPKRIKKLKNALFLYSFLGHEAGEAAELSILPLPHPLLLLLLLLLVLLHLRHLQVLLLYLRVDLLTE